MSDFNLWSEPWIPVLTADGQAMVGLTQALTSGAEIEAVAADLSTVNTAIMRLLAAIGLRATGPTDINDWEQWWAEPDAFAGAIIEYRDAHHDRFFLFDDVQPFYQVPDLHTAKNEVSALEKLVADVPNGEPMFTARSDRSLASITAAEAAQWLVHAMAWDSSGIKTGVVGDPTVKGGRSYPRGTSWVGSVGSLMAVGRSLRESVLLNMVAPGTGLLVATADMTGPDLPAWERPVPTPQHVDREPAGIVDQLTWQSRRIRLVGDRDRVHGVVLTNGDPLKPQNRFGTEPFTAWRYSEPQSKKAGHTVFMPQEHDPDRQVWRGLSRLLPRDTRAVGGKGPTAPEAGIVTWLAELSEVLGKHRTRQVTFAASGIRYGSQQAVVDEVIDDRLAIPLPLFAPAQAPARALVSDMVQTASDAVAALAALARNLDHAAGGDRDVADVYAGGFAALDQPLRAWIATLDLDGNLAAARQEWHGECRQIIAGLADELVRSAGPAAWRGRVVNGAHLDAGLADVWFRKRINRLLPRPIPTLQQEAS